VGFVKEVGSNFGWEEGRRFAPSRECPHLRIETLRQAQGRLWGTRFCGGCQTWANRPSRLLYLPRTPLLKSRLGRSASGSRLDEFFLLFLLGRGGDAGWASGLHPTLRKSAKGGAPEVLWWWRVVGWAHAPSQARNQTEREWRRLRSG
jgi:hypothetical protein